MPAWDDLLVRDHGGLLALRDWQTYQRHARVCRYFTVATAEFGLVQPSQSREPAMDHAQNVTDARAVFVPLQGMYTGTQEACVPLPIYSRHARAAAVQSHTWQILLSAKQRSYL